MNIDELICRKSGFYALSNALSRPEAPSAFGASYRVYRDLCRAGIHPNVPIEDTDFVAKLCVTMPESSIFRVAAMSFAHHNWPSTIAGSIAALVSETEAPHELNGISKSGPSAGHPAWHLFNPFFHLWRDAKNAPGGNAQDNWRSNAAIAATAPILSETEYAQWAANDDIERSRLCAFMRDAKPASLIDIGCGNGRLLRYAIDNFDGVFEFYGVDLHANRAAAALDLAQRSKRQHYSAAACQDDLLSAAPLPQAQLAIMNRVAGCFDDDQLRIVLGKIADSGAIWIFESEVLDSWDMWTGRPEPAHLFASAGWRLSSSEIIGDPITADCARYMVVPNKYWIARAVRVWARA